MKRLVLALAILATAVAVLAAPAAAKAFSGLEGFQMSLEGPGGSAETQAGAHPYAFATSFRVETEERGGGTYAVEALKDLELRAPQGFVAIPGAAPACANADFLTQAGDREHNLIYSNASECPDSTVVGETSVKLGELGSIGTAEAPVYNLEPPPGDVAKIGFRILNVLVTVDLGLSESPPYVGVARSENISQVLEFFASETTLWGVPAAEAHDAQRGECLLSEAADSCPAGLAEKPFLVSPRACAGPLRVGWTIDTWAHPGAWLAGSAAAEGLTGCDKLGLSAGISAKPTTRAAQSATGLDFGLDVHDEGIASAKEGATAGADIEKAEVTLPVGMSVNPSQAEGLEVCSEAQVAGETSTSAPGSGCPEASKIGTIEVETPLLETGRVLHGSLYVAEPYRNPFGSLIAFYIVLKDRELGVSVIQPARVAPDPRTGQLITTTEDMPQLPFSHFRLHFREGGRAPLISPPGCGSFQVAARLYPSSGGTPVSSTSSFQIVSGPNGGGCPAGAAPFHPGFEAAGENDQAGVFTPFDMRLTRSDGEQDMGKFSFVLPPGVVPKLAGIPYCSDAAIAQARGRQGAHGGQEELDSPSCPAVSQIGTTLGGAGVGSQLTYVPGKLYLAGPYHGDPISAVAIVPAVAGPFDAGTIVVREALRLNPVTHVGEVDGSASDPIPHILKGIPLNVREVRVSANKPEFTLNPTSCEPFAAQATIWGDGTALEPLAPHPVDLSTRFQAAGCASLGFKPRLGLKLRGGTKRGRFPALHAVYTPRPGDANLSRLALTFPKSEFIEQGHFRTICTRVQFAAGAGFGSQCPKGSIYGHIKVWTPLLDEPLQGPVYLRSSNHNLPDAVFALHGLVDIELATRIDSTHGRLRAIVADSPDAPVSRAIVDMQGGQKGLFVNSTNLCAAKHRARVNAGGQNGRRDVTKPIMHAIKCGKARRKKHRHHKRAPAGHAAGTGAAG